MIKKVSIGNMRALDHIEYELDQGINVIYGPNGCGKTSILESIFLLSQGFSFRAKDLKDLVRWNQKDLVLRGEFVCNNISFSRAVGVSLGEFLDNKTYKPKIIVKENSEIVKSLAAFFGKSPAVIMQPSDIELLRGTPEIRRRWLDEILCFRFQTNVEILKRYKRVLQQRNQWLRKFKQDGNSTGGEDLFKILTNQLVELGGKLWVNRIALTSEISSIISNYYQKLSGGIEQITCAYKSSILKCLDNLAVESNFCEAFKKKLNELSVAERSLGMTLAGPHRDDLEFLLSGYEMRTYASQGQCRSASIAMRFAAVDIVQNYSSKPILLLDDIFAELDINRRSAIASIINEKECQVIIATPQSEELPFKANKKFKI